MWLVYLSSHISNHIFMAIIMESRKFSLDWLQHQIPLNHISGMSIRQLLYKSPSSYLFFFMTLPPNSKLIYVKHYQSLLNYISIHTSIKKYSKRYNDKLSTTRRWWRCPHAFISSFYSFLSYVSSDPSHFLPLDSFIVFTQSAIELP